MKRGDITKIQHLQFGDRFYKLKDKSKTSFQLVEQQEKKTFYRTYKYFCCKSAIIDLKHIVDTNKRVCYQPINGNTEVVFLRNISNHEIN